MIYVQPPFTPTCFQDNYKTVIYLTLVAVWLARGTNLKGGTDHASLVPVGCLYLTLAFARLNA
jgi:hypothetical protein